MIVPACKNVPKQFLGRCSKHVFGPSLDLP